MKNQQSQTNNTKRTHRRKPRDLLEKKKKGALQKKSKWAKTTKARRKQKFNNQYKVKNPNLKLKESQPKVMWLNRNPWRAA
jgi:hypothetical protein